MMKRTLLGWLMLLVTLPVIAQTESESTEILPAKMRVDFTLRIGCYFPEATFAPTPYGMTQHGEYRNNYSVSAGFEVDVYCWKQLFVGVAPEVMHASGVYERETVTGEYSRKTKRTSAILPLLVGCDWVLHEKVHLLPAAGCAFNYVFSGSDAYRSSHGQEIVSKLKDLNDIDQVGWSWLINADAQIDELMLGIQYAIGLDDSSPDYWVVRVGWRF
ncbi:MAG: hypothetical protein E7132_07280 [Rikenellaceae bacterium]|nr:hypothetical protein [Rikenellaceae bacterium]